MATINLLDTKFFQGIMETLSDEHKNEIGEYLKHLESLEVPT